jgi:hypothetical protein
MSRRHPQDGPTFSKLPRRRLTQEEIDERRQAKEAWETKLAEQERRQRAAPKCHVITVRGAGVTRPR